MPDLDDLKIPAATRGVAETVIALTDTVCEELLDEEYASLARQTVAKLARKPRWMPVSFRGRSRFRALSRTSPTWAVSIRPVWSTGRPAATGIIYDPDDGLMLLPGYGKLCELFENPRFATPE